MADVFISYSTLDQPHAKLIAETLRAEGISVWWDRKIGVGEFINEEIDQALAAAKCVIVIWSRNSVKSKWVLSESTVADERHILVPVAIEPVRLPTIFRLNLTEDFSNWSGARDALSWQRIMLQVRALLGIPQEEAQLPAGQTAKPPPSTMMLRSSVAPLGVLAVLAVVFTIWGQRAAYGSFAVALGLALLAFLLFRLAEHDLSPHMKALARRWLLPKKDEFTVSTPEAFNYLFEAVFGRRHFTVECFARSTILSATFFVIILLIAIALYGEFEEPRPETLIGLVLFGFVVNATGDYIALLKTRLLLRWYRAGMSIVPIVLIDIAGILLIFVSMIALAVLLIYGISYLSGGQTFGSWAAYLQAVGKSVAEVIQQPLIDFFSYDTTAKLFDRPERILLYSAFLTMFMTSLWLWIALLLSPIVRLLVWSRVTGLTFLGFVFDVHNAPFAAMGYLSAFIILIAGAAVWGAGEVAAAAGLALKPAAAPLLPLMSPPLRPAKDE